MYQIKSFLAEERDELPTALTRAEAAALEWLHDNQDVELVSAASTALVGKEGTYIYIVTLTYKR